MTQSDQQWSKLTRADLTHCDDLATDIVLTAMALGGVGRLGTKGHIVIKFPNGKITNVSPRLPIANRSAANARSQFRQAAGLSLDQAKQAVEQANKEQRKKALAADRERAQAAAEEIATVRASETAPQLFLCPIKDCPTPRFTSEASWKDHVQHAHYVCKLPHDPPTELPDNWMVLSTKRGLSGHGRIVHEGHRPRPKGSTLEALGHKPKASEPKKPAKAAVPKPAPARQLPVDTEQPWFVTQTHVSISRAANAEEILAAVRVLVSAEDQGLREENAALRRELDELAGKISELEDIATRYRLLKEHFSEVNQL